MNKARNVTDQYAVIMAGGKGERFWPVSREKKPKQLISLLGKGSFLQQTVERIESLIPASNILVITNTLQAARVRKQLPGIPADHVVAEPCGRDTCAAVALGAAYVHALSGGKGVMAVLPADHVIPDRERYGDILRDCIELASKESVMVTIGIKPNEPATGYGYIQMGKEMSNTPGQTLFARARRFVEKPDVVTARKYLKSGAYRWNAGMFIWSVDTVLKAFQEHRPSMAENLVNWSEAIQKGRIKPILKKEYPEIEKISVDYALMEKADNVVVADGDFAWDDLGAWTALARHLKSDDMGNCALADLVQVDSQNNVVFDARSPSRRGPVALVGVKDSIIIQTDDATLIASKNEAQNIKKLVAELGRHEKWKKLV